MIERRSFLKGLIAAPLIVRADSLMQIRGYILPPLSKRWIAQYMMATDQIVVRLDVASFFDLKQPSIEGLWKLSPGLIANCERQMAPHIAEIENRVLKLGAPGSPYQMHYDMILCDRVAFDHDTRLLSNLE